MTESNEYLNFGDLCRSRLGMQCQYGSRYVDGAIPGWPNLGEGIRFKGNTNMYHSLRIHRDDVDEFFGRIEKYLWWKIKLW
jgi:hypothetical protein